MEVLLELQTITRPVSVLPLASLVVAASWIVCPVCRLGDVGDTATDATGIGGGALTAKVAEADAPSLLAVIVVEPGATPVTSPLPATVAIAVLALWKLTTRPVSALPSAS